MNECCTNLLYYLSRAALQDATDSRHNESVVGGGKNDIPAGIKRYTYHLSLLLLYKVKAQCNFRAV
jgi:hypothetical protein